MRITLEEKATIVKAVTSRDPNAEVYLFGSRTNPLAKGGDIDLLVLSDRLDFHNKVSMLVEIKSKIGERKIDLLIRPFSALRTDPFVAEIMPKAVRFG